MYHIDNYITITYTELFLGGPQIWPVFPIGLTKLLKDEIPIFLILNMHLRNKKLGILSLYLA